MIESFMMSDVERSTQTTQGDQENRRPNPDPVIEMYKRDVDRSLLRENLKLTPDQRLRKLQELQQFAAELQAAGRRAAHD